MCGPARFFFFWNRQSISKHFSSLLNAKFALKNARNSLNVGWLHNRHFAVLWHRDEHEPSPRSYLNSAVVKKRQKTTDVTDKLIYDWSLNGLARVCRMNIATHLLYCTDLSWKDEVPCVAARAEWKVHYLTVLRHGCLLTNYTTTARSNGRAMLRPCPPHTCSLKRQLKNITRAVIHTTHEFVFFLKNHRSKLWALTVNRSLKEPRSTATVPRYTFMGELS